LKEDDRRGEKEELDIRLVDRHGQTVDLSILMAWIPGGHE